MRYPIAASFIRQGRMILLGNPQGEAEIVETQGFAVALEKTKPIQNCLRVQGVMASTTGTLVALNCIGRTTQGFVRVLQLDDVEDGSGGTKLRHEVITDFYDAMSMSKGSGLGWITFSWDNEYLIGTSGMEAKHHISVWSLKSHNLMKMVTGDEAWGQQGKLPTLWHMVCCPYKAMIVTVGKDGKGYIWTKEYDENWACFAPGFEDLKENKE